VLPAATSETSSLSSIKDSEGFLQAGAQRTVLSKTRGVLKPDTRRQSLDAYTDCPAAIGVQITT
jgi:hypothetical protein